MQARIAHTSPAEDARQRVQFHDAVRPLSAFGASVITDDDASSSAITTPSVDPWADSPAQLVPREIEIPKAQKAPRTRVGRDAIPAIEQFALDSEYLGLSYSVPQLTLLKAIYGRPLTSEERDCFGECTGRKYVEGVRPSEVTVIAGARSGKDSRIAAPVALYEALYGEYAIARGERGVIPLVAQNADGAQIAFAYIHDYALERPRLARWVDNEGRDLLVITNAREQKVRVQCFACSAKAIRGWSIPAAVMDEVAFFRIEGGQNADGKVQTAMRRGGVNFAQQTLVKITTPSVKDGIVYDDFARYWGVDAADVLVWRAPTTLMNPTIVEARIARERRKDPAAARVEYDAEFAEDVSTFLPMERIEAVRVPGRAELAPVAGVRYLAAVDPSGGGADAFALAIMHAEKRAGVDVLIQDVLRSWRPMRRTAKLDLEATVKECAAILARFGLYRVVGDQYAGDWPSQEFRKAGVLYVPAERTKSEAYLDLEPKIATGTCELLDHPELIRELGLLEKRYKLGGKTPTIDHPKGGHDDHANAAAHVAAELAGSLHPSVGGTAESFERAAAAQALAEASGTDVVAELERMYAAPPARPRLGFFGGASRPRGGMFR